MDLKFLNESNKNTNSLMRKRSQYRVWAWNSIQKNISKILIEY